MYACTDAHAAHGESAQHAADLLSVLVAAGVIQWTRPVQRMRGALAALSLHRYHLCCDNVANGRLKQHASMWVGGTRARAVSARLRPPAPKVLARRLAALKQRNRYAVSPWSSVRGTAAAPGCRLGARRGALCLLPLSTLNRQLGAIMMLFR